MEPVVCARGFILRRLLSDVCSYVSRNASVSVARRGLIVACRDFPSPVFVLGLVILKKFKNRNARLLHYLV